MSFSAVNGLGLALVIPAAQSLVADYYEEKSRGGAFGLLFGVSSLGASLRAKDDERAHVEQEPVGPRGASSGCRQCLSCMDALRKAGRHRIWLHVQGRSGAVRSA